MRIGIPHRNIAQLAGKNVYLPLGINRAVADDLGPAPFTNMI